MNPQYVINQIFSSQTVADKQGNTYPLNSNIDKDEGAFIQQLIKENKYTKTIEVGCAFGFSSLHICDALKDMAQPSHTIVDPFQYQDWHGIGIKNLDDAGIDFYHHIQEVSEFALPKLAEQGEQFDFAFIDGWHTFDHTLIDFFYLNRVIRPGGMILIDDTGMLAIRKLVRYLLNYPCYELVGGVELEHSASRHSLELVKSFLRGFARLVPSRLQQEVFLSEFLKSDKSRGIDCSMIALKKVAEDERPWNWYCRF